MSGRCDRTVHERIRRALEKLGPDYDFVSQLEDDELEREIKRACQVLRDIGLMEIGRDAEMTRFRREVER